MQFGIVITSTTEFREHLSDLDASLIDTLYVVDHPSFAEPDPWAFLAWVAGQTERIRLGTHVTGAPFHHPIALARQVTAVDVLSGGRVTLGIGTAYEHADFEPYGFEMHNFSARVQQMQEIIEILKSLWTKENTVFSGEHFQLLGGATFVPKPVQKPTIPIIVGLNKPGKVLEVAVRHADGINTWQLGPEQIAAIGLAVRENCEKVGRNPDTFAITADLIFARDQNVEVADQIAGQIASMARSWGRSEQVTQWDHSGVLFGNAEHMLDQIEVFKSVGVSEIAVSISSIEDALWFNENVLRRL
tara:strand:- start:1861 stop:2766 length:906 start_codon:yes stop_codon:yes gene_type:complete